MVRRWDEYGKEEDEKEAEVAASRSMAPSRQAQKMQRDDTEAVCSFWLVEKHMRREEPE